MPTRVRVLTLVVLLWPAMVGAQTISTPAAGVNAVASANDFATFAFQDPWDMSERTDLGWFLHGVDQPSSGFGSFTFAGGVFSGMLNSSGDSNLFLLETGFVGAAQVGKVGTNYPINANAYTRLVLRMRSPQNSLMQFFWSTNTIYDPPGLQTSNPVSTSSGWRYYFVNLPALGLAAGSEPWGGTKRSLRMDPSTATSGALDIDWVRLTDFNAALQRDITWSGFGGNVDIYLAANTTPTSNPANLLGLVASNVSGGSFTLYVGGLAPGDYYVAIRRTGQNVNFTYSPGLYRVNAPARVTVTAPSDEGSTDDFATTFLGNPWDMTSLSDVDFQANLTGMAITTVNNVVNEAGTPLGNVTALAAANTTGTVNPGPCNSYSDGLFYPLNGSFRGYSQRIDPGRYRILTAELGVPFTPRQICNGSVARIVWRVAGHPFENVSEDIVLNSRADATVLSKISLDMATLPIDPSSPDVSGWVPGGSANPGIDSFRIDPHEILTPTPFFVKRVKLAALETAHTSYTVQWTSTESAGTVNVFYDDDKNPAVRQFIGTVAASSTSGSLVWNTAGLPDGAEYYVFVEFNDGSNLNGAYSRWPVRIDHTPGPTASLIVNRPTLNFGVTNLTQKTPMQTVRVTAIGAPAGQPCWTVSSDLSFVLVSPASGCGTGSLTVRLQDTQYGVPGIGFATIAISSAGASNSPQFVRAWYRIVSSSSTPPSGVIDTPANGATVAGSVAFTGWTLDDIGVTQVTLCRNPIGGETPAADGRCGGAAEVYVGNAVLLDDARPDVEGTNPSIPFNYRAGWGFLVLTNMLPNQGNGQFVFKARAFDVEGLVTQLGTRTINCDNQSATAPFGAIDTPGQGEVVSGTAYFNFGWVLTPQPKIIPTNGSTITVFIDGLPVGNPSYNHFRSDIASLFPGLQNSNGAAGVLTLNTTLYPNGVHTIAWGVTDNQGAGAGIGSRYFTIFNTGQEAAVKRPEAIHAGADLGRAVSSLDAIPARLERVRVRRGFDAAAPLRPIVAGMRSVGVWHQMFDRVELHLEDATARQVTYEGYLVKGDRLEALPIGSSLDRLRGVFAWQPGVGYIGSYVFVFLRTLGDGSRERIPVRVVLEPTVATRVATVTPASRAYRGLF